jgi:glucokinase
MYASGSGLGVMTRAAATEGRLESVLNAVGSIDEISSKDLEPAVDAGDPEALAVLDDFSRLVAVGVANLVHILDLEVVVIGGGLVDLGAPLIEAIQRWTDEFVLGGDLRPRPRVVAAELGSKAGALGAALIARDSD